MLYHAKLGIPGDIQLPRGVLLLKYGHHALREARRDRNVDLSARLPEKIMTGHARVIEVETDEDGEVTKVLYRMSFDGSCDICLVVTPSPGSRRWFVKTVWCNTKEDRHATLRTERYAVAC